MNRNFFPKKHGALFLTVPGGNEYQQLRCCLSEVSWEEQASFATYLAFTSADAALKETTEETQSKQKVSNASIVAEKILKRVGEIQNPKKEKVVEALECKTEGGGFVVVHASSSSSEITGDAPPAYAAQQVPAVTSSHFFPSAPPPPLAPPAGSSTVHQSVRPRSKSY